MSNPPLQALRMKNYQAKKERFLDAVRILAPGDTLMLLLARRVPDAELPEYPGGAALDFVSRLQGLDIPNACVRALQCEKVGSNDSGRKLTLALSPSMPPAHRHRHRAG
jgi:hypothetical protein